MPCTIGTGCKPTKEENSFLEKIERKQYKKPFEEMEDLSAMRVICYYDNDIEKIENLIKDINRIEHHNGLQWYDYKIHLNALIRENGYNSNII